MILVFGKNGQVATELQTLLPNATFLGRDEADLTDPEACARKILELKPTAVINAAAYTAVDKAETDADTATLVNGSAPTAMANACAQVNVPFVHISTDYVFDGTGEKAFAPDHQTGPLGVYGETKLIGENGVREAGGVAAILRTSWVFSAHGGNFVKTMLRLGYERDKLTVVADQIGGPTPARAIAQACVTMVETLKKDPSAGGTYHFSGDNDVSWADFARAIFEEAQITCDVEGIPTSAYPTLAKRPTNSRMDCTSLKNVFGIDRPDWRVAVQDTISELKGYKMIQRKGIILAGGSGTRLYPLTMAISKQLMPIYDKPMIYYPLSVLMLAGIREVAMVTTPQDQDQFKRLLGDGSQWGIEITYIIQPTPDGLAQAYILAEDFLDGAPSAMVLGDNIFFGHGLPEMLKAADEKNAGGTVFGYHVADPERYGVVKFDADGTVEQIIEKPEIAPSNYAVTGLYFLDGDAPRRAKEVKPSHRGEVEIVTLLETYLNDGTLSVERMGRGYAWLDTGTHGSLLDAGNFVRTLSKRQGMQSGCPEEIAYSQGWTNDAQLLAHAETFKKTEYGQYLKNLLPGSS